MKQFIVVYGGSSRFGGGYSNLVYKTVNVPDNAKFDAVERVMRDTTDGPYTTFVRLIDPSQLETITLAPAQGFKIQKDTEEE